MTGRAATSLQMLPRGETLRTELRRLVAKSSHQQIRDAVLSDPVMLDDDNPKLDRSTLASDAPAHRTPEFGDQVLV